MPSFFIFFFPWISEYQKIHPSLYQQISIHCLYAIAVTKIIMSLNMFMVAVEPPLERLKTVIQLCVYLASLATGMEQTRSVVTLLNFKGIFHAGGIKSLFIAEDNLEHLS